jgi:hypothetical protein
MMSDRPRIELNTVQVVASMAAAVTGAVLTSYLGDGGTIVGTAVGSGASTAGFAVYKHYLARTKEKMAPVIVDRARQWGPITATQPSRGGTSPGTQATPGKSSRTAASPYPAANGTDGRGVPPRYTSGAPVDQSRPVRAEDAPAWDPGDGQTRDFRRPGFVPGDLGPRDPGTRDSGWGGHRRPRDAEQADTQIARPLGTVRMGGDGYAGTGGNGGPGDYSGGGPGSGHDGGAPGRHGKASGALSGIAGTIRSHPRWVVTAATSVAVFLVAMLVITLIEFGTGKPIDASVWGRKASGTTLGNVTGGQSNGKAAPTDSSTPTQSATPGVGQTAPEPNSSATTAPTPSSVPSVNPSPGTSVAPSAPAQNAPAQ